MTFPLIGRKKVETGCTVEVVNTFESLAAHVVLHDDIKIAPGDEVIVHGKPIEVPYGETHIEARTATVVHASPIGRLWTRMTGDLEFMELCEFSFSEEATL